MYKNKISLVLCLGMSLLTIFMFVNKVEAATSSVNRLSGVDRYDTNLSIVRNGWTEATNVIIANGENFPDALSIAPIAAAKGVPILLSPKNTLADSTKTFLLNKNVPISYIIGGLGSIGPDVQAALKNPKRLYGVDRYKTNISIIKEFEDSLNFDNLYVASGKDFPDALSGSVLASNSNSPISLVDNILSADDTNYLKDKSIKNINILGGAGAVKQAVEDTLKNTAKFRTITKVDDITDTAFINEDYHFPVKALATYDDSSEKLVNVHWNSNNLDTSKEDSVSYTGIVDGYDGTINLKVKVIEETGGINGNLANRGLMSYYKGYIYYCNPNDGNRIYKMTHLITEGVKLCDDSAFDINIVKDTIYYINCSDNNSVYRMSLDGSQRAKITGSGVSNLLVFGDSVYFSVENSTAADGIYKMKTDGNNNVKLADGSIRNIAMEDGRLYFTKIEDISNNIYTMNSDGSGKRKISEDNVSVISLDNGWIYYINTSDDWTLYKIKLDGTNRTRIADEKAQTINVYNGWIYFSNGGNWGTRPYKIRTDGSDKMVVSLREVTNIFTFGDYVFYESSNFNTNIYAAKLDGSKEIRLAIPILYDNEPNNDLTSSQEYYKLLDMCLKMEDVPVISGSIQSSDIDLYKITLGYSNITNLLLTAPDLGQNAIVTLLDCNGKEICSVKSSSIGYAAARVNVPLGTYYIRIAAKEGISHPVNYSMIIWLGAW